MPMVIRGVEELDCGMTRGRTIEMFERHKKGKWCGHVYVRSNSLATEVQPNMGAHANNGAIVARHAWNGSGQRDGKLRYVWASWSQAAS